MMLLFFFALMVYGILGRVAKKSTKSNIRVTGSQIARGSLIMKCGCRVSADFASPCQAHRLMGTIN